MGLEIEQCGVENGASAAHNSRPWFGGLHLNTRARKIAICWVLALSLAAAAGFNADQVHASSTDSNGRKLYRWVDDEGVVHYGDKVPPEYATQERQVVNKQGVEIERLEAQKTPEQLAAEEKKKRDLAAAQARDKNLLNTYVSVQEIERLRDQRLALVSDQIKVTTSFLDTLNGHLSKLRAASMQYKPYSSDPNAPPMPDALAEDLVHTGNDIHTQEQNLRQKRADEATMKAQFDSDIARYKELKGIH